MTPEEIYKTLKASADLYAEECIVKNIPLDTKTSYITGAYWAIRNINLLK